MDRIILYTSENAFKRFKEGEIVWATDKQIFNTDCEITVNKDDNLQFINHDKYYCCNVYSLENVISIEWANTMKN